jgi:hypothetical protein
MVAEIRNSNREIRSKLENQSSKIGDYLVRILHTRCSSRREENPNSKQEQQEANEQQSGHRHEQQKRHRAAALQNLAEIAALWNSRQRRGVRQPYAALASIRWQVIGVENSKVSASLPRRLRTLTPASKRFFSFRGFRNNQSAHSTRKRS